MRTKKRTSKQKLEIIEMTCKDLVDNVDKELDSLHRQTGNKYFIEVEMKRAHLRGIRSGIRSIQKTIQKLDRENATTNDKELEYPFYITKK